MFVKSTIFLAAAALLVSAAPAGVPKCAEICSMEYNPVCGKAAAGALRVFNNPCQLQVHNCKNPKDLFAFENDGQCCPMMCSMIEDPICAKSATDGQLRVFSNACSLNLFNCQNPQELFLFQAQGECCPQVCSAEYKPVCGISAKGGRRVFANACQLKSYNCQNPKDNFNALKDGEC
ncbi:hypothetical protein BGZ93_007339 [Podila epicladia]|nr:hypothetical protein BGZ92_009314 [Podila epicladia]KAG0094339.1 hypothetical protein BGZ93_007339 [Podila epicladia]